MGKRIVVLLALLLTATALWADTTFDSRIYAKETKLVYGNGTLSVATTVNVLLVMRDRKYMRIEVSKDAFDLLNVGDLLRITLDEGFFGTKIKEVKLLQALIQAPTTEGGQP